MLARMLIRIKQKKKRKKYRYSTATHSPSPSDWWHLFSSSGLVTQSSVFRNSSSSSCWRYFPLILLPLKGFRELKILEFIVKARVAMLFSFYYFSVGLCFACLIVHN